MSISEQQTEIGDIMEIGATDFLPDDLVTQILLRLPTKSLIRFRSVQQPWNQLITSNQFKHEHHQYVLSRNQEASDDDDAIRVDSSGNRCKSSSFLVLRGPSNPELDNFFTLLTIADDSKRSEPDENFYLPYIRSKIPEEAPYATPFIYAVGYGLYCIMEYATRRVALWNPATRELKVLPSPSFIQTNKACVYGFGCVDYKDNEFSYKVGIMHTNHSQCRTWAYFTVQLYSSTDNLWKLLKDCFRLKISPIRYSTDTGWLRQGTHLNNKFHWFTWLWEDDPHIVTFDMNTEEFGRIEAPSSLQHRLHYALGNSCFTKLDDNFLCLILFRKPEEDVFLDIWVMLEYGIARSWVQKFTIGPLSDFEYVNVLGIHANVEGMLLQEMYNQEGLFFCSYRSSYVEHLLLYDHCDESETMHVVEHKESLVSFNGSSDMRSRR